MKRQTNYLLTLVLIVVAIFIPFEDVKAANPASDFIWGLNDDGTEVAIYGYIGTSKKVVIPSKINGIDVTTIAGKSGIRSGFDLPRRTSGVFEGMGITEVTFPDTMMYIGDESFENNNLTEIYLPESVTTINERAFANNDIGKVTFANEELAILYGLDAYGYADKEPFYRNKSNIVFVGPKNPSYYFLDAGLFTIEGIGSYIDRQGYSYTVGDDVNVFFSPNGSTRWSPSHDTRVLVSGTYDSSYPLEYVWSGNTSPPNSGWKTFNNNTYLSHSGTGQYYLHIRAKNLLGTYSYGRSNAVLLDSTPSIQLSKNGGDYAKSHQTVLTLGFASMMHPLKSYAWSTEPYIPTMGEAPSGTEYKNITVLNTTINTPPNVSGDYYLHVWLNNNNDDTMEYFVSNAFKLDNEGPIVSLSKNGGGYARSHSTTITAVDSHSGLSNLEYRWTTSSTFPTSGFTSISNSTDVTAPSSTGNHYLHIRATDNLGHITNYTSSVFRIDRNVPTLILTEEERDQNGNIPILVQANDSHSGIKRIKLPNGQWVEDRIAIYRVSENGIYTFVAEDNAGNTVTRSITISSADIIGPAITLTPNGGGYAKTHSTVINAVDEGSGLRNIEYRWTTSSAFPTSGFTTTTNSRVTTRTPSNVTGDYYLHVRATDNSGNVQTLTSKVFKLDNTIPTISLSRNGGSYSNNHTTVVNSTDAHSGLSYIEYAVTTSTTFPSSFDRISNKGLISIPKSDGNWYVHVRAVDKVGNVRTFTSNVFRVDVTLPSGTFNPDSSEWSNSDLTTIFTPSDNRSGVRAWDYRISSNGGSTYSSWKVGSSGSSSGTITDSSLSGNIKVQARVVDNAGNSRIVVSNIFKVDKIKPIIDIESPLGRVQSSDIPVEIKVSDTLSGVSSKKYVISNSNNKPSSGWVNMTSNTQTVTIDKDGSYYVHVEVTDVAGNKNYSVEGPYERDTDKPNGHLTQTPLDWTNGNVTLILSEIYDKNGIDRVIKPNGEVVNGNVSEVRHEVSSNGTYTFKVYDSPGNMREFTIEVKNIDKVKPVISLSKDGGSYAKKHTTRLEVSDNLSGIDNIKYRWTTSSQFPSDGFTNVPSGADLVTPHKSGNHYLHVEAVDKAGNITKFTSKSFQVDVDPPIVVLIPNGGEYAYKHTVVVNVTDKHSGISEIEYVWSNSRDFPSSGFKPLSSGSSLDTPNGTGNKYLHVRATDKLGNIVEYTSNTFRVDQTKPVINLNPNGWSYGNTYTTDLDVRDSHSGIKTVKYRWTESRTFPTSGFTVTSEKATLTVPNTSGDKFLHVIAEDNVGNITKFTSNVFMVDTTPPIISINPNGGGFSKQHHVLINVFDQHSGVDVVEYQFTESQDYPTEGFIKIRSGDTVSTPAGFTGYKYLHVRATDKVGNEARFSSNMYLLDNEKPNVNAQVIKYEKDSLHLYVDAEDTRIGLPLAAYKYYINGTALTDWIVHREYMYEDLSYNTFYDLSVEVRDGLGNTRKVTLRESTLANEPDLMLQSQDIDDIKVTIDRKGNNSNTRYILERSDNRLYSNPKVLISDKDNILTINDTGLETAKEYFYRVRAMNNSGKLTKWINKSIYTLAEVPSLNLSFRGTDNNLTVNINGKSNPNTVEYYVQRSTNSSFTSDIKVISNWDNNKSLTDSDLEYGKTYYYRVKARNGENVETEWSDTVSILSLPKGPNITKIEVGEYNDEEPGKSLTISWESVRSADIYELYEVTGTSERLINSFNSINTSHTINNLIPNKDYEYKVRAKNRTGYGNFGNSDSAFTRAHSGAGGQIKAINEDHLVLDITPSPFIQGVDPEYKLELTKEGELEPVNIPDVYSRETKSRIVRGLEPNTVYDLWLITRNRDGVENPEKLIAGDFRVNRPPVITLDTTKDTYSEHPNHNKINISGKVKDRDINDTLKVYFTILRDGQVPTDYTDDLITTIKANGGEQSFNHVVDIDNKLPEGSYTLVVKVIDELSEYDETSLNFKVDKTAPEGNLSIVNRGLYSAILNLNGVRDVNLGLHNNPILFEQKINNGNFSNYGNWSKNTVLSTGELLSNTKYTYRANIRDIVENTRISNEVAFVTSPKMVEKDVYYLEEDPATLVFDWENELTPNDGVSIEIRRSNTLIAVVNSGSRYIDDNLGYERDYTYTFTAVSEDSYGNRIESFPITIDVQTGLPILELVINEDYDINEDEFNIYTTKFSDTSRIRGTVFFRQGGVVDITYGLGRSGELEIRPYETKRFEIIDKFSDGEVFDFKVELRDSIDKNKLSKRIRVIEKDLEFNIMSGRDYLDKTK